MGIIAVLLGLFMRSYQMLERFNYAHDNDLASWIVKDIVVDGHLRLIGQLTSSPGIYIGALWYYLQIPFYLIGNMDPMYVPLLSIGMGLVAIISVYYVVGKMFGKLPGGIASVLYAGSNLVSGAEREVVPTMPVFLWTIWFLYSINQLLKGDKKGLIIIAVLWGLIWHIHLALIFSVPLVIGVLLHNRKKYALKDLVKPLIILVITSAPLMAFETRHGFSQVRSFFTSTQSPRNLESIIGKSQQVILYAARNINSIFWLRPDFVNVFVLPVVLVIAGGILVKRKVISGELAVVFGVWALLYLVMFSLSPLNLSEYYLHGLTILWIVIAALALSEALTKRKLILGIILTVFSIYNLQLMLNTTIDRSGYLYKKMLVKHIADNAKSHNYPCVSVSYMTDPGRDLGYRYWFWLENLHVNRPDSGSPVYTIVFPHTRANRLDKSFGSLGLVYPDYDRYRESEVENSCMGNNSNLTDPMFGFSN